MRIKICGLKREKDIDYVNEIAPDFVGFVFAGKKRKIDYETAKFLRSRLNDTMKVVGVFVNEDMSLICRLVQAQIIDWVQIHGEEDERYIRILRQQLEQAGAGDTVVVKAVGVKSTQQVLDAEQLPVDYLLLDASSATEYGGTGMVFDHALIPNLKKPYFLAGGMDSENVTGIIKQLQENNVALPYCIDVSSSVETDGAKDKNKIHTMVLAVRGLSV